MNTNEQKTEGLTGITETQSSFLRSCQDWGGKEGRGSGFIGEAVGVVDGVGPLSGLGLVGGDILAADLDGLDSLDAGIFDDEDAGGFWHEGGVVVACSAYR